MGGKKAAAPARSGARSATQAAVSAATSANELLSAMLDCHEGRCDPKDIANTHPNVTPFLVKTKLRYLQTLLPKGVTKDTPTSFAYSRAVRKAAGVTTHTAGSVQRASRRLYTDDELKQALIRQMVIEPPATKLDTHAESKAKFGVSKTTMKDYKALILAKCGSLRRKPTPELLKVRAAVQ
jgi:hypothetical protein